MQIRQNRLLSLNADSETEYVDRAAVAEEIAASRRLFAERGWPAIDVTRRSIEETAAAVLDLYRAASSQIHSRRLTAMREVEMSLQAPRQLPTIWRGPAPLILASKSRTRHALLAAVGLDAEVVATDIDERTIEARHLTQGGSLECVSVELARAKALAASASRPRAYCVGADQTLTLESRIVHKSRDFAEASKTLAALAGRTHRLTSAFCVARDGRALVVDRDHADLRMRPLDSTTISGYLARVGPAALASVGLYRPKPSAPICFDAVEGEYSVVLGLPMLKFLAWLRRENLISL